MIIVPVMFVSYFRFRLVVASQTFVSTHIFGLAAAILPLCHTYLDTGPGTTAAYTITHMGMLPIGCDLRFVSS